MSKRRQSAAKPSTSSTPSKKSPPLRKPRRQQRRTSLARYPKRSLPLLARTPDLTTTGTTPDTTTGSTTTDTTTGTTATDTNLLLPGECEKPFPVPPLKRTYRIYLPLTDLFTLDSRRRRIAPPQTLATSLLFNARAAATMERAADAFGGIPLNALDKASNPRWEEPMLTPVKIKDAVSLVRTMAIKQGKRTVNLKMGASHISELVESGSTLAPRADGGFIRLELGAAAKVPVVQNVTDLESFLREPAVVMPDGLRRPARLSSMQLSKLASGVPVVSGSGPQAAVLITSPGRVGKQMTQDPPPATGDYHAHAGGAQVAMDPSQSAYLGLALLLPLDQTWLLKTYERGRLASSISLTPQEEVTVDVYSWDRRKTSQEDTTTFDSETSADSQGVDRDTKDVFGEITKTGTLGWGLNGSFSGYGLSLGGNAANTATLGNTARTTLQKFHEQTVKASEKVHTSRQLKITESTETGSEDRTTRKLRNNNLCHPVTHHYFELNARYIVTTQYDQADTVFVLLVDNPLARPTYDVDYVRTYESALRSALLDPAVASGFEAARTLWMLSNSAPVICNDCVCASDCVGSEESAYFALSCDAVVALNDILLALQFNARSFNWNGFFASVVPVMNSNQLPAVTPNDPGILSLRQALFVDAINETAPGVLDELVDACQQLKQRNAVQLGACNSQFAAIDLKGIDTALAPDSDLQSAIKGLVEARIRHTYSGMALSSVAFLQAGNRTGNVFIDGAVDVWNTLTGQNSENGAANAIVNAILWTMGLSPGFGTTDAAGLEQRAKVVTNSLAAWVTDTQNAATTASQARDAHKAVFAAIFPPADVLMAQERFDALVKHLQAYDDYYANIVVTALISRGQFQTPPALLPWLGIIAPQPTAVVNGKLAYAVDLSVSSQFDAGVAYLQTIVNLIPTDASSSEVTLPTPGFVVEPKLSCCSACEDFVEQSRTIDLELKQAQADQAKFEASRRQSLLAAAQYDPFDPIEPALKISVEQTAPAP